MKNLKFLSILLFSILNFCLASCGNDDDEIGGRDMLVGTWQCTWSEGYAKYANDPSRNDEWSGEMDFMATFKDDGMAVIDGDECRWKLEGDKLYIVDTGTKDEWDISIVLKLTDSELIIEQSEKDSERGYEFYDKITFKKI